ncbi:hypothetical protein [Faecalibacterium sp. 9]
MQHSDGFCRVNRRQNESDVLRGGKFFARNKTAQNRFFTEIAVDLLGMIT